MNFGFLSSCSMLGLALWSFRILLLTEIPQLKYLPELILVLCFVSGCFFVCGCFVFFHNGLSEYCR